MGHEKLVSVGLMSGTSMDGVDAALLETDGEGHIIELGNVSINYDQEAKRLLKAAEKAVKHCKGNLTQASLYYPEALQTYLAEELRIDFHDIEDTINHLTVYLRAQLGRPHQLNKKITLDEVTELSTRLHATAVKKLLAETHKKSRDIDVIGFHGQTLFHNPTDKITVQIGDGNLLAELTGITVVNDFRSRDVAAGGQGAPFAPIYHQALAKRDHKIPLAVVNCGGIANISLITTDSLDSLIGFDTGPGNGLIDKLIRERSNGAEYMDTDGHYGLQGYVHEELISVLFEKSILKDGRNYFNVKPPKSLDIRDMHLDLIPEFKALSLEDACATLEAFTAESIVKSLALLDLPTGQIPQHWVLAGGGWYNPVIRRELEQRLQARFGTEIVVQMAADAGWNGQAMEAQIFAHFAVRSLKNLPLSVPGTTKVPTPLSGGHAYVPPAGASEVVEALLEENPDVLSGYQLTDVEKRIQEYKKSPSSDVVLTTEASHPDTVELSQLAQTDLAKAHDVLIKVDQKALTCLLTFEDQVNQLAEQFFDILNDGNKIFFTGCGSAARAAVVARKLFSEQFPAYADRIKTVSGGGELVVVRAAEGFEDKPEYGVRQLKQAGWTIHDGLVGISASGAAAFVHGQIKHVVSEGGTRNPVFFCCNPLEQCQERFSGEPWAIFHSKNESVWSRVDFLNICVREMGVSGSTRMQAATVQLIVIAFALTQAGQRLTRQPSLSFKDFMGGLQHVLHTLNTVELATMTAFESSAYQHKKYLVYRSSPEHGLTVATDTTERSPTFSMPYFENDQDPKKSAKTSSICRIIIDQATNSVSALRSMLGREPEVLNWSQDPRTSQLYLEGYDLTDSIIEKRREYMPDSLPAEIKIESQEDMLIFSFEDKKVRVPLLSASIPEPLVKLYEQLVLKMVLNNHSTLVAGNMHLFQGNQMTHLRLSNRKLVGRGSGLARNGLIHFDFSKWCIPAITDKNSIDRKEFEEIALFPMMRAHREGESVVLNTQIAYLNYCMGLYYHYLLFREAHRVSQEIPSLSLKGAYWVDSSSPVTFKAIAGKKEIESAEHQKECSM